MKELKYDSFAARLLHGVHGFEHVYEEHVADYDEVLPHVLLGDLVRFLAREVELHGAKSVPLKQAMSLLEGGMSSGDSRLEQLIAVSFLENLDPADASFSAIRMLFGPGLEAEYGKYEHHPGEGGRLE